MTVFDAERLANAAQTAQANNPTCACLERDLTGWNGWPAAYHEEQFVRAGTLAQVPRDEATLEEYHPANTSYWSPDAPIAPRFYPYNQCGVWTCVSCARLYLRHNDEGAYHSEKRIRRVLPEQVVDAPLTGDSPPA